MYFNVEKLCVDVFASRSLAVMMNKISVLYIQFSSSHVTKMRQLLVKVFVLTVIVRRWKFSLNSWTKAYKTIKGQSIWH